MIIRISYDGVTRDVSILVRYSRYFFSRREPRHHTITLSGHQQVQTTEYLRANGYCSFFERLITNSEFMNIPDISILRFSKFSILDSRSSILASRNSNVSTFATRESSFEDRVETVNLPLSGTVSCKTSFLGPLCKLRILVFSAWIYGLRTSRLGHKSELKKLGP